jgi:hypothetical protein
LVDERRSKGGKEFSEFAVEAFADISTASTEDAAEDVPSAVGAGNSTIRNGKCQRTDVVGDDTVCSVDAIDVCRTLSALIGSRTREFLNRGE